MPEDTTGTRIIPREILFGNAERSMPRLSPDGRKLAYLAPVDGVMNVWVGSAGGDDFEPVTRDALRGIRIHFWAEDGRHLLYMQDEGGDENWRIYAVDPDTRETRDLTPFDGVQAGILKMSREFPDRVLISMNRRDPRLHDVYGLDISTGEISPEAENPGDFAGWLADESYEVRGGLRMRPDGGSDLLLRDGDSGWREAMSWSREDSLGSGPVGYTSDGNRMYLLDSRDANATRLVEMDVAPGESRVLAEDPEYDVSDIVLHPETREVQAVGFTRSRTEWRVLDPDIEEDFRAIAEINPGDFHIVGRTRDDRTWLVGFDTDRAGHSYYTYSRDSGESTHLFDDRPLLGEYDLAEMTPVSYTSRDGLEIHGYLTLPQEGDLTDGSRDLPLVLNVHGGPWARDTWGYNPEAQWLANRGYACLQVNYRGSTGYGKAFLNAGDREWGARMHDDLVDAVAWAVSAGIADPDRVGIYGGSYGGYAALVGATFTPDLFRCAVDLVGPSNLITLINTVPPYWEPLIAQFHQRVGDPATEEEFLKSRSPLFKVDEIRIPMLIAQGANDPRVKQSESEQIVAAMEERGVDHEYLLFEDEGHGFARPENRLKFYAATEDFLARHLDGRSEN